MVTPWTIPKLVTWRVKDWASCFLPRKFPLDNNGDRPNKGSDNDDNNGNMNNIITYKKNKRKTRSEKRERKLSLSPPTMPTRHFTDDAARSKSLSPAETRRMSWPPVSDEGFIVFCFDRDGSFDVLKEEIPDGRCREKPPRTVNRKLTFGNEEERTAGKNMLENRTEQERNENTSCLRNEDVSSDIHNKEEEEEEEDDEDEDIEASGGSSGSNQSGGGRGSFAFPILGMEWMGSPVQMPKSDDLCSKKQKPVSLGLQFQCCRF